MATARRGTHFLQGIRRRGALRPRHHEHRPAHDSAPTTFASDVTSAVRITELSTEKCPACPRSLPIPSAPPSRAPKQIWTTQHEDHQHQEQDALRDRNSRGQTPAFVFSARHAVRASLLVLAALAAGAVGLLLTPAGSASAADSAVVTIGQLEQPAGANPSDSGGPLTCAPTRARTWDLRIKSP
jgi:hypothetical protein